MQGTRLSKRGWTQRGGGPGVCRVCHARYCNVRVEMRAMGAGVRCAVYSVPRRQHANGAVSRCPLSPPSSAAGKHVCVVY